MKPPERDVLRQIIQDWLNKAELDIASAEYLLSHDPPLLYPSCFHSQQAAEKCLKAFLTWKQVEFPKTHIIEELLDLISTFDIELAASLESAAKLTPYGVDLRYPGDQGEPSLEESRNALRLAAQVRDAVLSLVRLD